MIKTQLKQLTQPKPFAKSFITFRRFKGRHQKRKYWPVMVVLTCVFIGVNLAQAQVSVTALRINGEQVQGVNLFGAEYVSLSMLSKLANIERKGSVLRMKGMGRIILMPIDEDQERATTSFNTVQIDAKRLKARTATRIDGSVYIPLDTLAQGLGATYSAGSLSLPPPTLRNVSSRAGKTSDRLVLDLNRNVDVQDELRGTQARVVLKNTSGKTKRYATRGAFMPYAQVNKEGSDMTVSFTLPQNSGYRVYSVVREGGVRLVIDVGPGIPKTFPALMERIGKPLIVLDPLRVSNLRKDITLEVARRAGKLLSQAGWQVQLTRTRSTAMSRNEKLKLARRSDVYLALDLGRFPDAVRSGVTVYEQRSNSPAKFVDSVRNGTTAPYASLAVGDTGGTRKLSELIRGELKSNGIQSDQQDISKILILSEAPQAALLLEMGWMTNAQDRARFSTDGYMQSVAVATARSIATYLTARANNASENNSRVWQREN